MERGFSIWILQNSLRKACLMRIFILKNTRRTPKVTRWGGSREQGRQRQCGKYDWNTPAGAGSDCCGPILALSLSLSFL